LSGAPDVALQLLTTADAGLLDELGRARVDLLRPQLAYAQSRGSDAPPLLLRAAKRLEPLEVALAFARRAERELQATGGRVRKRVVETQEDLTAQEAQIARFARDGFSNPEIAARLFISPRTVEYHLHKVFSKPKTSSRNELGRALQQEPTAALAV
jgi:DNA-binding NarL/FixJ family response regulator